MNITTESTLTGKPVLVISDAKDTYKVFFDLNYDRDTGHGGGVYASGINITVRKEV
jgi:hypothetical protein